MGTDTVSSRRFSPPLTSVRDAILDCTHLAHSLGYPYFGFCVRFERVAPRPIETLLSNAPRAWLTRRAATDAVVDPLQARMNRGVVPFGWDEVPRDQPDVLRFFTEAADYGLADGLCLPLHCPGTELAALTLAGASPPALGTLRDAQFADAWLFAVRMLSRLHALLLNTRDLLDAAPLRDQRHQPPLARRERLNLP